MPKIYKKLGSSSPTSATYTNLYSVPAGTQTVISSIAICNATASARTFRLAQTASATAASATALADHFVYDTTVPVNDTTFITAGISLNDRQNLVVYSSAGSVIFTAWGVEIS